MHTKQIKQYLLSGYNIRFSYNGIWVSDYEIAMCTNLSLLDVTVTLECLVSEGEVFRKELIGTNESEGKKATVYTHRDLLPLEGDSQLITHFRDCLERQRKTITDEIMDGLSKILN